MRGGSGAQETRLTEPAWRELRVDGIEIAERVASPQHGSCRATGTAPAAVILAVDDGCFTTQDRAGAAEPSLLVVTAADAVDFTVLRPARLLRIVAPAPLLPRPLRALTTVTTGPVSPTPLTRILTSLTESVLNRSSGGTRCPAARAIRPLTIAALEDLAPTHCPAGEREQILDFIEAHLTDPALTPRTIATAFGISLRWAHHVFDRDQQSLARHIRNSRLDRVAAQLTADGRLTRIGDLAAAHGFTREDQMTRAFRARYQMPITRYAALAAEGLAPQPLGRPT